MEQFLEKALKDAWEDGLKSIQIHRNIGNYHKEISLTYQCFVSYGALVVL